MRILALETSTERGTLALLCDGAITGRLCPPERPHSETLLPLVRALLAEAGLSLGALDAIAFSAGPGAFTGLRVACGVAQGLAAGAGLPVLPVCTLEVLAAGCGRDRVIPLLDARMNEVYSAHYERHGDIWRHSEIRLTAPEALPLPETNAWLACGNALAAYPYLAGRLASAGFDIDPAAMPEAIPLAHCAARHWEAGKAIDPALAAPFYVRNKVARTLAERLAEGGKA